MADFFKPKSVKKRPAVVNLELEESNDNLRIALPKKVYTKRTSSTGFTEASEQTGQQCEMNGATEALSCRWDAEAERNTFTPGVTGCFMDTFSTMTICL